MDGRSRLSRWNGSIEKTALLHEFGGEQFMLNEQCGAFKRNPNGSWTTVRSVIISNKNRMTGLGSGQTIDPGDVLAGLDVVDWLEHHRPLRQDNRELGNTIPRTPLLQ